MAKKKIVIILLSVLLGVGAVAGIVAVIVVNTGNTPTPAAYAVTVSGEAESGGEKLGEGFAYTVNEESAVNPAEWQVPAVALSEERPTVTYRFTVRNEGGKDANARVKRPEVPAQFGLTASVGDTAVTASDGYDEITVVSGETKTLVYVLEILACNRDVPSFGLTFTLELAESV